MKKPVKKPVQTATVPHAVSPTINDPSIAKRNIAYAAWICAAFAFLLYANTLSHDYTVDDGTVISNNSITKKGISAIPEIFSSSYRAGFWQRSEGLYRPLSVAMFAVEWELAPENPAPGHWINVILYALTAFLLLITLASVFKEFSLLIPFFATLIFVAHPIHTEVVANIKSRDEILCLLFSVFTLFLLHKWVSRRNSMLLALSAISFFLAYLSKENAITVLVIIPIFLWFFSDLTIRSNLAVSSLFAGVTAIYLFIRLQVLGELTGSAEMQLINNSILGAQNFADQLASALAVMGKYIYLLFIPHPLAFDYSYNQIPVVSFGSAKAIISALVCGFLAWRAFSGIPKKDPASFGLLFFFGTISLVANILFLIESTMAERFLYMPSLGFAIAISFFIVKFFKVHRVAHGKSLLTYIKEKQVLSAIFLVVLVLFSFKTISRNSDWKNNLTLLAIDVKTSPNSARIRYAYGSALLIEKALKEKDQGLKNGYLDKSIVELERGVSILPNYAEAWNHLGIAYKEKNNIPAAIASFEKARSFKNFKDADFYISSGLAYGLGKQYDKAIADFTTAIGIDPANGEAFNNKGLYFTESGRIDSALIYFDKAILLKKDFYQAYYNKGNAFAKLNDFNNAIAQYQQSLKINPSYTDAMLNLGNSYAAMKDFNKALECFKMVEKNEPSNAKVIYNIGITYRILGDEANAVLYIDKATKAGIGK